MTNEEILEGVIKKAVKNGWKIQIPESKRTWSIPIPFSISHGNGIAGQIVDWDGVLYQLTDYSFIFSHEFAKAFWGEELEPYDVDFNTMEAWKVNLQQMVLEKEPLKYIKKYV